MLRVHEDTVQWGDDGKLFSKDAEGLKRALAEGIASGDIDQDESRKELRKELLLMQKSHAADQCMQCKAAPDVEFIWAEGRARAWFCAKHGRAWAAENQDDINASKMVSGGKVEKTVNPAKDSEDEDPGNNGQRDWEDNWFSLIPATGMAKFSYQRHYRGLEKRHALLVEEMLLTKDNQVHGDFRIGTDNGEAIGWAVQIGEPNYVSRAGDRFTKSETGDTLIQLTVKPLTDSGWLEFGKGETKIVRPEDLKAEDQDYAKYVGVDKGTYTVGVVGKNTVELFLNGDVMKGRVVLQRVEIGSTKTWVAKRGGTPTNQTTTVEDVLKKASSVRDVGVIYGDGVKRPSFIPQTDFADVLDRLSNGVSQNVILKEYQRVTDPVDMMITKAVGEKQYTFGVLYLVTEDGKAPVLDAHGEFVDRDVMQEAIWDYVDKGDRRIFLQHMENGMQEVGRWVEIAAIPFDVDAELKLPDGTVNKVKIPAGSVWVGVIWTDEGWALVKSGATTGLSMGGMAVRDRN